MSIVYAGISPHPPLLIPSVGKENTGRLEKTRTALGRISAGLEKAETETIIIISPHGQVQSNFFTMNLAPEYTCDFEDFGDFSTKKTWAGNVGLAHRIRESLEISAPLQLVSEAKLDHGASVPLYLLTDKLPKIKIIPLYYSGLSLEAHFEFGRRLKRELLIHSDKIAIIASGDLSHRLTRDAPAGYSPRGKKFDKKLTDYISKGKIEDIINIDEDLIIEAGECGLRSILILLGMLDGMKYSIKPLNYEGPFGVGYLTCGFNF